MVIRMNNVVYRKNEFFKRIYSKHSREVPDYRLDEKEKKIVQVGLIDFQEKIQSSADCDYRKVFDRFLINDNIVNPNSLFGDIVVNDSEVADGGDIFTDKLTANMNLYEKSDEYKRILGLDSTLTPAEVFNKVSEIASKLKDKNVIVENELLKIKENDINEKKI